MIIISICVSGIKRPDIQTKECW